MIFLFYFFASLVILSSVFVICINNPVHAVLFLILTFVNCTVLFIILGAEFIAMIILIVYTGAIAILFLFVVMMLDIEHTRLHHAFTRYLVICPVLCIIFFLIINFVINNSVLNLNNKIDYNLNNIKIIGNILYTDYMYAFHFSGILLLVSIIGAITLTLSKHKNKIKKQSLKQLIKPSSIKIIKGEFRKGIKWK